MNLQLGKESWPCSLFEPPPPHGPGLHSRAPACCAAYALRSHVKLHHSEVHRISSPGELLVAAHGHLGEGRVFFPTFFWA